MPPSHTVLYHTTQPYCPVPCNLDHSSCWCCITDVFNQPQSVNPKPQWSCYREFKITPIKLAEDAEQSEQSDQWQPEKTFVKWQQSHLKTERNSDRKWQYTTCCMSSSCRDIWWFTVKGIITHHLMLLLLGLIDKHRLVYLSHLPDSGNPCYWFII